MRRVSHGVSFAVLAMPTRRRCRVYRHSSSSVPSLVVQDSDPNSGGSDGGGGPPFRRAAAALVAGLLPLGYPLSVAPSYLPYAQLAALGGVFSAAGGVLSLQSLFHAVGVGAAAAPLAAAMNWVMKDGLGQLGGMAAAAVINTRYDADPKRWRMAAACALDASTLLEICTPLVPALFLPLAAVANVGKNVSWLSASATRAAIHQAMATSGNLADVTANAGSQTIAASTAGSVLGMALAASIGHDTPSVMAAFACLSGAHLLCVHGGLRRVALPSLSALRLRLAVSGAVEALGDARGGSPGFLSPSHHPSVLTPEEVAAAEGVLIKGEDATVRIEVGTRVPPPLEGGGPSQLLSGVSADGLRRDRYCVAAVGSNAGDTVIHVWYHESAEWQHVLTGYLHALLTRELLRRNREGKKECGPLETRDAVIPVPRIDEDAGVLPAGASFRASSTVHGYTGASGSDARASPPVHGGGDDASAADACVAEAGRLLAHRGAGAALLQSLEGAGWWVGMPLLELSPHRRLRVVELARPP